MKTLISILLALATSQAAFGAVRCSTACKAGLLDAEFEFAYHSGASSTQIATMVYDACGESEVIETECAKKIRPNEGSIVYLYYAACVHEKVKKVCEDLYGQNR